MKLIRVSEDKFIVVKNNDILYSTYPVDYAEQIDLSEIKELIRDGIYTENDLRKAFFSGGNFREPKEFEFFINALKKKIWDVEMVGGKLKLKCNCVNTGYCTCIHT